ncbi:hypothetical protein K443DRAFT_147864 [Laccaria amethystina LaAM-08-1]|uniref:ARID domain-containing protein n=1 Tax=Laccaria amethystina LaAM-08-1 TaxID=1095629 RepID=A0A0C9Y8K7_9AGAR|nr:hypothetical protein K443DRAFT_147864 [Laccaria amethystina LaAM-08-1]
MPRAPSYKTPKYPNHFSRKTTSYFQKMGILETTTLTTGAGMTASQETTAAQIANLLRSQDVASVQRQQQQQQPGLPSGRDLGPTQQQQGSHDSASNQPQHLSIGFAATGEVPNTSVNAATLQQPNSPFQPQTATGQLELPQLAQKEQLGPVPVNREHQPQDVSESSPEDALSSPGVSNAAGDHPTNHVQSTPTIVSSSQPQPVMPNSDLVRALTQSIAEAESGQDDPGSAQQLTVLKTDKMVNKGNLNKVIAMLNVVRAHQGQIQGGSGAKNQTSWTFPNASFENNSQPGRPTLGQNPPQQQQQHLNGIQAKPSPLKAQASSNHLMPQGAARTRSVSTPHQQAKLGGQHAGVGGPFANQVAMSGSMGGHFPLAMNGPSRSTGSLQQGQTGMNSFPPPMDKVRFEQSFRAYCTRKSLNVKLRQLQIDNRPVDLYQLHRNVMLEFGVSKVEQKALWDVIGGRMGYVQFSGTATEPAKSGPGVAQQIAHIYKDLLAAFDRCYINSVFEARLKAQAQVPRNPAQMSPQVMQRVLTCAHMSVPELHRRGVPEKIITFVEANRANLQRTYADQRSLQSRLLPTNQNDAQGSGDQNGPSGGQRLPFGGPPTQQNPAVSLGHFLQQQKGLNLLEDNDFLDYRQPQQRLLQQGPPMQTKRPTKELLEKSKQFVQNFKRVFNTTTIPSMSTVDVPVERQAEYLSLLDTLHTQCQEIEPKLATYLVFTGNDVLIKRMTVIICTVAQQKSFGASHFIVTLDILQKMLVEIKTMAQRPFAHNPVHQQPQRLPRPNDAQGWDDVMEFVGQASQRVRNRRNSEGSQVTGASDETRRFQTRGLQRRNTKAQPPLERS